MSEIQSLLDRMLLRVLNLNRDFKKNASRDSGRHGKQKIFL